MAWLWNLGISRLWNILVAWLRVYGNKLRLWWRLGGLFHLLLLRLRRWDKGLLLLVGTHASKDAEPRDREAELVLRRKKEEGQLNSTHLSSHVCSEVRFFSFFLFP
jgi:hypothetical protein